jgi:hypothetical protein
MKYILLIFSICLLVGCSKPKTVLICGDHVCINKAEAEKYFEENLSIEVKIIERKNKKRFDLVELNMQKDNSGVKKVNIFEKEDTEKNLKVLSEKEILKIKSEIKAKKTNDKDLMTENLKKKKNKLAKVKERKQKFNANIKNVNKKNINVVDVCTILKKCSIDEISRYLIEKGKDKNFPDITLRK